MEQSGQTLCQKAEKTATVSPANLRGKKNAESNFLSLTGGGQFSVHCGVKNEHLQGEPGLSSPAKNQKHMVLQDACSTGRILISVQWLCDC